MIAESLTRRELNALKRNAYASLLRFKSMLVKPQSRRFGKMSDDEIHTLIRMEKNSLIVIGMAIMFCDSQDVPGLRININV